MVTLVVLAALAVAVGLFFAGSKYGAYVKEGSLEYERAMRQIYVKAHTEVSAKLAAVEAELGKIEAEAKVEEQAVVARLKKLL